MTAILPAPISTVALAAGLFARWQEEKRLLTSLATTVKAIWRRLRRKHLSPDEAYRLHDLIRKTYRRLEDKMIQVEKAHQLYIETRRRV